MTKAAITQGLTQAGILPLYYHPDGHWCTDILHTLYEAGIRYVEFTNRGDRALENFVQLVRAKEKLPDLYLGIGTIHQTSQATAFVDAGADFLVSPFFDSALASYAQTQQVLWIPGCMTPTEIHQAVVHGCKLIKLFPGEVIGPSFVQAIKPLFNDIQFIVTGGITTERENIQQWLSAGADVLGFGSKLIKPAGLKTGSDLNHLRHTTESVRSIIQDFKRQAHG